MLEKQSLIAKHKEDPKDVLSEVNTTQLEPSVVPESLSSDGSKYESKEESQEESKDESESQSGESKTPNSSKILEASESKECVKTLQVNPSQKM